jgi:hypothetical protein
MHIALEYCQRAEVEAKLVGPNDRRGQRRHVLEAKIESCLAIGWMPSVASPFSAKQFRTLSRASVGRSGARVTEPPFQFMCKGEISALDRPLCIPISVPSKPVMKDCPSVTDCMYVQ